MSLKTIPLQGKYKGYLGVLDTETLYIYRVPEQNPEILGQPINDVVGGSEYQISDAFDTLVLHISNMCNMKCRYCFAGHGSYQSEQGLMNPAIAVMAVKRYYSRYRFIREIKFFGGEPALNLPAILAVGECVEMMHDEGAIEKMPVFKIIMNGTILNDELINLINRFKIKVVFSIDGPASVHNMARTLPNGSGSFSIVKENFFKLRQATDEQQPYSINVTYNHIHEENHISIHDIVRFCTETFSVKSQKVNVSEVSATQDSNLALQSPESMLYSVKEALFYAENGDARMHMKLQAIVKRLKKRRCTSIYFCSAAGSWSAVSFKGDVYPCLMFMDRKEYYMGNVSECFFEKEPYLSVYEKFQNRVKSDQPGCLSCDYRNLCSVCMGINEYETGDLYLSTPQSCEHKKDIIMMAVRGIAEEVF